MKLKDLSNPSLLEMPIYDLYLKISSIIQLSLGFSLIICMIGDY